MKLKGYYLPERLVKLIQEEADRLQISNAEVLRRILDSYFNGKDK